MKVKVATAEGETLNWMVAKAIGDLERDVKIGKATSKAIVLDGPHGPLDMKTGRYFRPSTDWSQGGPIIEREKIGTWWNSEEWVAQPWDMDSICQRKRGPTKLAAAMRCFVTSRLGDEVDVPEELA